MVRYFDSFDHGGFRIEKKVSHREQIVVCPAEHKKAGVGFDWSLYRLYNDCSAFKAHQILFRRRYGT